MKHTQKRTLIAIAAVSLLAGACAKRKIAATPPPPVPPATTAAAPKPDTAAALKAPPQPLASSTQVPRYPNAAIKTRIDQLLAKIEDAYFDYNKASLRTDALKALQSDSTELRDILKDYPQYKLTIEGHCDERGSAEYNMALGDKRAQASKDYLVQVGIPEAQLNIVSYGAERPICQDHDEACWQRNRRIHIVAMEAAR